MVVSVPVVLVARFARRLSGGSGSASTVPFCVQAEVAAGCNFDVSVRTGVWHGHETWCNTGLLSFAEGFSNLFGRRLLLFFLCKPLTNASVALVIFWCKQEKSEAKSGAEVLSAFPKPGGLLEHCRLLPAVPGPAGSPPREHSGPCV